MQDRNFTQTPNTTIRQRDERYSYGQPNLVSERVLMPDGNTAQSQPDLTAKKERPVLVERTVNKPIELITERAQVYETVVEYPVDIFVEVPKEQLVKRDIIIEKVLEKPIRKIKEVEVETVYEIPTEIVIEKPVVHERVVENKIKNPVYQQVEKVVVNKIPVQVVVNKEVKRTLVQPIETEVVQKPVYVSKPVYKTREVEVPVEVPYDRFVDVPVDVVEEQVVYKNVTKEIPVEKFVDRVVDVPVDKIVDVEVVKHVDAPYEVLVTRDGQRLDTRTIPGYRYGDYQKTRSHSQPKDQPIARPSQPATAGGYGTTTPTVPSTLNYGNTGQTVIPSSQYQPSSNVYRPSASSGQYGTTPGQYQPSGQTQYQPIRQSGHTGITTIPSTQTNYQPGASQQGTTYLPSGQTGTTYIPSSGQTGTTTYIPGSGQTGTTIIPTQGTSSYRPGTATTTVPQQGGSTVTYRPAGETTGISYPQGGSTGTTTYQQGSGTVIYPSAGTTQPGLGTTIGQQTTTVYPTTRPFVDPTRVTKDLGVRDTQDTGRFTSSPTRPDGSTGVLGGLGTRETYPPAPYDYNLPPGGSVSRNLFPSGISQLQGSQGLTIRDIGGQHQPSDFTRYQPSLGVINEEPRGLSTVGSSTNQGGYIDGDNFGYYTPSQGGVQGSRGGSYTGPQYYTNDRPGGVNPSESSRTYQPQPTVLRPSATGTLTNQPQGATIIRSGSQTLLTPTAGNYQGTTQLPAVTTTTTDGRQAIRSGDYNNPSSTPSIYQPNNTPRQEPSTPGYNILPSTQQPYQPPPTSTLTRPGAAIGTIGGTTGTSGTNILPGNTGVGISSSQTQYNQPASTHIPSSIPVQRPSQPAGAPSGQHPDIQEGDKVVYYYVDKIVPKYVEDIIEKYVDVPVVKEVQVPIEVFVEKVINNERKIYNEVEVNRIVEGPTVERKVEKEIIVEKVIEKPIYVDKKVIKEKEIVVEKLVEVPTEKFVENVFEKIVEVDVNLTITKQKPVFCERDLELTTKRRRRTSHANENLRASLHHSVERMNQVTKENADLKVKLGILKERAESLTARDSPQRRESVSINRKDDYERLKGQYQSLKERISSLKSQDERARARHSVEAGISGIPTQESTRREMGGRISAGDLPYREYRTIQGSRVVSDSDPSDLGGQARY
jgi:hypothetical protein